MHDDNIGISNKFQMKFKETGSAFLRFIYLSFSPWKVSESKMFILFLLHLFGFSVGLGRLEQTQVPHWPIFCLRL